MLGTYLHKGLNFLGAILSILIFIMLISFTPDPEVIADHGSNDASLNIMLNVLPALGALAFASALTKVRPFFIAALNAVTATASLVWIYKSFNDAEAFIFIIFPLLAILNLVLALKAMKAE